MMNLSMKEISKKEKIWQYIIGTGIGIGFLVASVTIDLPKFIDRSDNLRWFIFLIIGLAMLVSMYKHFKFLAYGFISGTLTLLLLVVIFIVELTIHPPDEE